MTKPAARKEDVDKKRAEEEAATKAAEPKDKTPTKAPEERNKEKDAEDEFDASKQKADDDEGEDASAPKKEAKKEEDADDDADDAAPAKPGQGLGDVRQHAADMAELIAEATKEGATADDAYDLLQDIKEDFDELCSMLDGMMDTAKEAEAKKEDEGEAEDESDAGGGEKKEAKKEDEDEDEDEDARPGMVMKGLSRRVKDPMLRLQLRKLARKMEAIEKALASQPEGDVPARYNDGQREPFDVQAFISGKQKPKSETILETLKEIKDPAVRDQLSRMLVEGVMTQHFAGKIPLPKK